MPKKLSVEDLNLTPEEMEILISGARAILPGRDPQENETLPTTLTAPENPGP